MLRTPAPLNADVRSSMYIKPAQYPEMQGLSSSEQKHLLKISLNSHGKAIQFRFYVVLVTVLLVGGVMGAIDGVLNFSQQVSFCIPIALGVIFYIYLLWEINGAIHAAVQSMVKQNSEKRV